MRSCVFGKEAWKKKNQNEWAFPVDLDSLGVWATPPATQRPQFSFVDERDWSPRAFSALILQSPPSLRSSSWDEQLPGSGLRAASWCQVRPGTRSKAGVPLSCCWESVVRRKLDCSSWSHLLWWNLKSRQPLCGATALREGRAQHSGHPGLALERVLL